MAKKSLRRYDVQAQYAFLISLAAIAGVAALVILISRNFNRVEMSIVYSKTGMYGPMVFLITALTMLLAATAVMMGLNSAGQKRNELNRRSWIAFFLGTATLSITLILFAAFWLYRLGL